MVCMKIEIEEKEKEAIKKKNSLIVCVRTDRSNFRCCSCKAPVKVSSPAYKRKDLKRLCAECFFRRIQEGKKDVIVITRETIFRAAEAFPARENSMAG